ncbi:hydantoinase [Halobacteriales archaeon SW_5_70_135]|nr:MAG: hydantoinase [Halobacteriales archaeon SW_5_70_135]
MTGDGPRVGVDVGGTFTDLVAVEDGRLRTEKTASTPAAREAGVVDALDAVAASELSPSAVEFFGHGTTVATNAVIEREWAETALLTTEGFRDALEIGRQDRPALYDLSAEKPAPVVERDRRYGVPERTGERGDVLEPLDEAAVRETAAELRADGVDGVAVSLLFAFENDDHERRVAELLREELDAHVSLSSVVHPEIREYERTLVTALNAALAPVMDDYLGRLKRRVRDRGVDADPRVMGSAGGLLTATAARERPVHTLLSGPAAGVQGATHVAGLAGVDDLITMDMGGTSCDVSLVKGGEPVVTTDVTVGDYPVGVPAVDVHTVGAGGGSVAWLDDGGALRVGPESAGADPGPVCYGRGGDRPTTTDAHLLLGRLDPAAFAGDLDPDRDAVRAVFERDLADPLGVSVREAAEGVLRVADANTERALRVVSVERGHDPRSFALVAFGGAGPLHAPSVARELDVPRVLVPPRAGVLSALGLLVSDAQYEFGTSRVRPWRAVDAEDLRETLAGLRANGRDRLAEEGIPPERRRLEPRVDLRYEGQSYELSVPVPSAVAAVDADTLSTVADRFHERHRRRYGHAYPDGALELVTVRLRARGVVPDPDLRPSAVGGDLADAVRETRPVVHDGTERATRVYDREAMPTGVAFEGPAVVEGTESTLVVGPERRASVDEYGTLDVEVAP